MKKKKQEEKPIWSATQIKLHLEEKFNITNNNFWKWFFSDSAPGDVNILEFDNVPSKYTKYSNLIKKEYLNEKYLSLDIEYD